MAKPAPKKLTDDKTCPYCDSGRRKRYYCERHLWAYRNFYDAPEKGKGMVPAARRAAGLE